MGKAVIIIVAAVTLGAGYLMFGAQQTAVATDDEQNSYAEKVIANEIAQSAYNLALSRLSRDYTSWRPSQTDVSYQGGSYDLTVEGPADGPVDITVEGKYGKARVELSGTIVRGFEFLDAVTADGTIANVEDDDNTITISGHDTKPPSLGGNGGTGASVHGIRSLTAAVDAAFRSGLAVNRVIGVDGTADLVIGPPEIDAEDLMESIQEAATQVYTSNKTFEEDDVLGSPENPVVIYSTHDIKFEEDARGYGIIFADGKKVEFKDESVWEGLIVQRSDKEFKVEDDAAVYGAVYLIGEKFDHPAGGDPGLPGGHFDVDVFEYARKIYHEHQYDDKFDVTSVDLLSADCKTGGGLCFDEVIGDRFEEMRVEFFNSGNSSGSYSISVPGSTWSGSNTEALSIELDPRELTEFTVNFTSLCALRASSPKTVQKDPVNRNDAWTVRMFNTDNDMLVYELSIYHHAKETDECHDGGDGSPPGDPLLERGKVRFKIDDHGAVYYSVDALTRLSNLLPDIEELKLSHDESSFRVRSTDLDGNYANEQ